MNTKLILAAIAGVILLFIAFQFIPRANSSTNQAVKTVNNSSQPTVIINDSGFNPTVLRIKVGTKITWINQGNNQVIVASNPHPTHTDYPPLNLGKVDPNGSLSLVFDQAGSYGYHNHLNPSQIGKIEVQ